MITLASHFDTKQKRSADVHLCEFVCKVSKRPSFSLHLIRQKRMPALQDFGARL